MNSTKLDPPIWKGQNYRHGGFFGARVLIVGESTYTTDGGDTSQYNVWMAENHIDGYRDAFRTKLVRSFLNTDSEQKHEIKTFWDSVCYLNYITIPLGGPRIAPEESMWAESSQPLAGILTELKPNLLVALGYRMWSKWLNSPPCKLFLGPKIDGAGRDQTYYFEASDKNHRALSYALKHPSSGFSWKNEHPFLMRAIEASKELR
jgi:hypothetical protein